MDLRLTGYTCGFSEEGADGGSCADAATMGPALCGGVVHTCGDVFEWRHAKCEHVLSLLSLKVERPSVTAL